MPPMTHIATKVNIQRNAYGDYESAGSDDTYKCHFREIIGTDTGRTDESLTSDAIAWFEPDAPIVNEEVLIIQGQYYKVKRVIQARRLRSPAVVFIKAELDKFGYV